ncbi:hypothetical protein HY485_01710 [Candidatus Woesearchaeota archaeon]|nr:hypothetical protein [Candidatus Woesearchaeota archaeon]
MAQRIPVKEFFEVDFGVGPFDRCINKFKESNVQLTTTEELAELRMCGGYKHSVSNHTLWVAESLSYLDEKTLVIASRDYNQILKNPEVATKTQRDGQEFKLEDSVARDLRERAETDADKAIKTGVLLVQKDSFSNISVDALDDNPATRFLFRSVTQEYARFLKSLRHDKLYVWFHSPEICYKNKPGLTPYAEPIWVDRIVPHINSGICHTSEPNDDNFYRRLWYEGFAVGMRRIKDLSYEPEPIVKKNQGYIEFEGKMYVEVPQHLLKSV